MFALWTKCSIVHSSLRPARARPAVRRRGPLPLRLRPLRLHQDLGAALCCPRSRRTPVDQPDGKFPGDVWGHVVAPRAWTLVSTPASLWTFNKFVWERGCFPATILERLRRPCRPRHPYAVPRTSLRCVCTRCRNCIAQLSPWREYALRTVDFPARNSATIELTHYPHRRGADEESPSQTRPQRTQSEQMSSGLTLSANALYLGQVITWAAVKLPQRSENLHRH
jgi:hypothetical protein